MRKTSIIILLAATVLAVPALAGDDVNSDFWSKVVVKNNDNHDVLMQDLFSAFDKDTGCYIMRAKRSSEANEDGRYLALHNCTNGHHNRLGLVVHAYGRPLLVDPGNSEQSPEHNALALDGRSYGQNQENLDYNCWNTLQTMDFFDGRCRPFDDTLLDRQILFVKPYYWVVTDQVRIDQPEANKTQQRWHFTPSSVTVNAGTKTASTQFTEGGNLQIIPLATKGLKATTEKKDDATVLILERETTAPVHYATIIRPFSGPNPGPVFHPRFITPISNADGDFTALAVKVSYGTDYIVISHNDEDKPTKVESKELECCAKALRATISDKGHPTSFAWVDGKAAVVKGRKLASSANVIKELEVRNDGAKVVITSSDEDPSLEVFVGGASQAVINEANIIPLEPGQKFLKPFEEVEIRDQGPLPST